MVNFIISLFHYFVHPFKYSATSKFKISNPDPARAAHLCFLVTKTFGALMNKADMPFYHATCLASSLHPVDLYSLVHKLRFRHLFVSLRLPLRKIVF